MKKITCIGLYLFLFGCFQNMISQTLNQNANWPNANWTVTGDFNSTDPLVFEGDPTIGSTFAYDDDDQGNVTGSNDNFIVAESPIIDLTAASTNGETWLTVSGDYVYRYLASDRLIFQYWDADAAAWFDWGIPFTASTAGAPTNDYCSVASVSYLTEVLNISSFTNTQLSGFKYRISYDDNPAGADWNYGFCFQSPTITSQTPPSCADPIALFVNNMTVNTADLNWTEIGSASLWDIELLDITNGDTVTGTPTNTGVSNPFTATGLTEGNDYEFYVRADCTSNGLSNWVGPYSFTLIAAPANDECDNAIALTVNTDLNCGVVTAGTTVGATGSTNQPDDVTGTPNTDVWFSFVATDVSHRVELQNVVNQGGGTSTSTDMGMGVYDGTGGCMGLVLVGSSDPNIYNVTGLTPGVTYYVRVYGWGTTIAYNNFDICVGTPPPPPPPPANDECDNAVALTVNTDLNCGVVTAGTTVGATGSTNQPDDVTGTPNTDVWFTFVATGASHRVELQNVINQGGGTSTSTDMGMGVYDGTGGCLGLVLVGSSDPNTYNVTGLTPGVTYYVRVYGWGTTIAYNNFDICVGTPPSPPANDDISGAISLTLDANFCDGIQNNGTNISATDSGEGVGTCFNGANGDNDVWFTVTIPANVISIDVSTDFTGGTLVDTEIALYSGTSGSLVEIACSQDEGTTILSNGSSWNSLITNAPVNGGETYLIQVAGYGTTNTGTFCIDVSTNSLSVEDFESLNFKYYPNPVTNQLSLKAQNEIQNVTIYNVLGQEVKTLSPKSFNSDIDMSSLQSGAYFFRVTINDRVETIRIIKN
jgi:hypothetical protein